jgi:methyl-accepting chemotaxis protein
MVQQIGTATNEQAKVSDLIISSVERMRALAAQVRSSAQEQAKSSNTIARSTEQITGMIDHIKTAADTQMSLTANITNAVCDIERSTDKNVEAATLLDNAVSSLSEQTSVLQKEMGVFKLVGEQPVPDDAGEDV